MPDELEEYLAVLKATYDYDATEPDECTIKENQLLLLLQRVDDDWWKIKVKGDSADDDEAPSGMVPAAYVEPADRTSVVKALYDYEASAPGELSIKEDEILDVFSTDSDWLLAQTRRDGGKAGYIPANYVEATSDDAEAEAAQAPPPPAPVPAIIVPDSPPKPAYVDPEERVASTKSEQAAKADAIKTWAISEVDAKNKKKKGTLGVGNGAVFFASESDKTPVKKWPTSHITHISTEKSKHIHLDIAGDEPVSLHFHAGSKDTADEIIDKLETSRAIATEAETAGKEDEEQEEEAPKPTRAVPPSSISIGGSSGNRKPSVHFSPLSPQVIPPRDDASDDDDEDGHPNGAGAELAAALYDFEADGEDELSVTAGEKLTVIEKDGDEWWKCRNAKGVEGVVPASYLEVATGTAALAGSAVDDDDDDESSQKDSEAEKAEKDRIKEKERQLEERERELKRKEEAQRRAEQAAQKAEEERRKRHEARDAQKKAQPNERPARPSSAAARPSAERERPPPDQTRIWHDRTGQFRVEAAFLGVNNGKFRLHKVNGVIVEVPQEKMSAEDVRYVDKLTRGNNRKSRGPPGPSDDDDVPLAMTAPKRASVPPPQQPKKPRVDWFEFFLAAGCDIDDCTRYAASFERDKIDEAILPDITESTMRSLGLREGDIIRVKKLIEQRKPKQEKPSAALEEQMRKDEELARRLQEEEQGRKPAPNLFSGPGGALKNPAKPPRRGRPEPSKTLPPTFVGADGIAAASARVGSPAQTTSPVSAPPRTSSAGASAAPATQPSGFDDDAWTVRPSSTVADRTPSAPPTSTPATAPPPPPAPAPPAAPSAPVAAPAPTQPAANLANKTESDIFDQLARLSELRKTQSPAAATPPPAAVAAPSPPAGYQQGMGMGPSPSPIGQLQPQNTAVPYNGPRGPFAPVPANQGLLQPLIPTQTGYNSFVPTRPTSALQGSPFAGGVPASQFLQSQPTGFQPMQAQPTGFQQPMQSQPTGFPGLQSQATGFPGMQSQPTNFQGLQAQPTGFQGMQQQQQPMMAQPTGMPMGGSPFQQGGFGVQSNPTGFNPNMGMSGNFTTSPPPLPSQTPQKDTSPANIFAQMKSGTFASDSAPQDANKYDALRPQQPMMAQPTGWVGGGFQGGYGMGYQR
ncbi:hypothetical protein HDZ31DRAFT_60987 [Schizophyllum fasciatum]